MISVSAKGVFIPKAHLIIAVINVTLKDFIKMASDQGPFRDITTHLVVMHRIATTTLCAIDLGHHLSEL